MRKQKALEVLREGGYFRSELETQWKGGEKFEYRLRDKDGHVVKGIGYQTYKELENEGLLKWIESPKSSTWPTTYILR
jgi:hypothetical protein